MQEMESTAPRNSRPAWTTALVFLGIRAKTCCIFQERANLAPASSPNSATTSFQLTFTKAKLISETNQITQARCGSTSTPKSHKRPTKTLVQVSLIPRSMIATKASTMTSYKAWMRTFRTIFHTANQIRLPTIPKRDGNKGIRMNGLIKIC